MEDTETTLRSEHLGAELRKLRKRAAKSLEEAAKSIDSGPPKLSKMETGKQGCKFEDVAGLLAIYGVGGAQRKAILAMALEADKPGWLLRTSAAEQIETLRRLEQRADSITVFHPLLIPGLLQTAPYILAVLNEIGGLSQDEAKDRLAARIQRQDVLRFPVTPFTALIAEDALHHRVGGKQVLRDQLKYLLEAGGKPKITIRIVPNLDRGHPGMDGPIVRLNLPDRRGVVHLESREYTHFLETKRDIDSYDHVIEQLTAVALDESASARLIADVVDGLERNPQDAPTADLA
ncbi:MAG TPA: helix-turn-helix transcriptional regulator [Pseudonocardiaceae bacterium]|nr:helix-turn-helix transcriptional regulator [Pseudonocardiaceae bacterium]